jgi:hypothetical protein
MRHLDGGLHDVEADPDEDEIDQEQKRPAEVTGAAKSARPPPISSMSRLIVRAQRPHCGLQARQPYT